MEDSNSSFKIYRAEFLSCPVTVTLFDGHQRATINVQGIDDGYQPITTSLLLMKVSGMWCIANLLSSGRTSFCYNIIQQSSIKHIHQYYSYIKDDVLYAEVDKVMNKIFSDVTVDIILG